jgi:thiamine biosynthesis protein ThiS
MISVTVNGEAQQLDEGMTVELLLTRLGVKRSYLAVERNQEIVPRTSYEQTVLADGDSIEIVTLVGGG